MSEFAKALAAKAVKAVDAIVDLALREPKPPHARGATSANDVMGPKAITGAVTGSVLPTLAMIVLAVAFCVVLWLFAKVGIWPIVIVTWGGIAYFLWRNWGRFDMGRVREALREDGRRDAPPADDNPTPPCRDDGA